MTNYTDVRKYYNAHYTTDVVGKIRPWRIEEGVRPYAAYEHVLRSLRLGHGKGLRLLDIACGRGFLLRAAEQREFETYGVDISGVAIRFARKNAPKSTVKVGTAERLPFAARSFDAIFCLGSLEHFLNKEKALAEIRRVVKPSGKIFIMVPNKNFIYYKIAKEGTHQQEIAETLWSNNEWRQFFEKNGLAVRHVQADDYHFTQRIFSDKNPLMILRRSLLRIAGLVVPLEMTYQLLYQCEKR